MVSPAAHGVVPSAMEVNWRAMDKEGDLGTPPYCHGLGQAHANKAHPDLRYQCRDNRWSLVIVQMFGPNDRSSVDMLK